MFRVIASVLMVLAILGGYYAAHGSFDDTSAPSAQDNSVAQPAEHQSAPVSPAPANNDGDAFGKLKM